MRSVRCVTRSCVRTGHDRHQINEEGNVPAGADLDIRGGPDVGGFVCGLLGQVAFYIELEVSRVHPRIVLHESHV